MKRLTVNSLSDQDISSTLLVGTYTADADRTLFIRLFVDQIAGGGDYSAYITLQRDGAGTEYTAVTTTIAVPGGVTNLVVHTMALPVKSTDVMKVYLTGLPGDTTTPDVICEFWEDNVATLGAGSVQYTITVDDGVNPLDGVDVWITTDVAGSNLIARGLTDDAGEVTFSLDPGSYYAWKQLAGYAFTNPESFVVP